MDLAKVRTVRLGTILFAALGSFLISSQAQMTMASPKSAAQLPPEAHDSGAKGLAPRPTVYPFRSRGVVAASAAYSIEDFGAPSTAIYGTFTEPASFNNADQMVGYAYNASAGTTGCLVFTGPKTRKFVDVSAGTAVTQCYPNDISASNGGNAAFVGFGTEAYLSYVPISGSVSSNGKASLTGPDVGNVSAYFIGVNASGLGVGAGTYFPAGGFFDTYPPLVGASNGSSLSVAQPQCTSTQQYCAEPYYYFYYCHFGGCVINDQNEILGYDAATGYTMVYTYGTTGGIDLPFTSPAVALNDAQQVLFDTVNPNTGAYSTVLYSLTSGKSTTIALPKNSTCTSNYGVSLNNLGEVLGQTGNCTRAADYVTWTWTAKAGLKLLSTELPANDYADFYVAGVNDSGQILVALVTQQGVFDWGILNPTK